MKVLVISQYYYPEPLRISDICEELVKRGHEVTVMTTNPNYPDGKIYPGYNNSYSEELRKGVKVCRIKSRPRFNGSVNLALNYISFAVRGVKSVLNIEGEFDIIYVYQLSPITSCIPAIYYKKKKNIPIVLYCLDIWPESLKGSILGNGYIFNLFKYMSKYIYSSSDKIVVTSPSFVGYISELCGLKKSEIDVLVQHSADINDSLDVLEREPGSIINFMFIGNIGESQNIECLIESLTYVRNIDRVKIHFVGSGSYLDKSVKLSKKCRVNEKVIFHGRYPKSKMAEFYKSADVCLVSLKDEGITGYTIPGKVQEYMAAGKPILACINGDTAVEIKKANCGICTPADDRKKLAEAIDYMIENMNCFKEWGNNARRYYEENYTLEKHIDKLEKILQIEEGKR